MRLFSKLYVRVLSWAEHRYAPAYLTALSFSESIFFPVPTDVILAPMVLASPQKAWYFAFITTLASVSGGIVGYYLGYYALTNLAEPMIYTLGYTEYYQHAIDWFDQWGIWVIFIVGFLPIPYKLFTITAGALHMLLLPFVLASFVGRGARFYLVSALIRWGGARLEAKIRQYIDIIGWAVVALIIIVMGIHILR